MSCATHIPTYPSGHRSPTAESSQMGPSAYKYVRGLITKQASCTRGPPPEQMVVHQSSNEDRSKHVHHHGYQGVLPAAPQTSTSDVSQ